MILGKIILITPNKFKFFFKKIGFKKIVGLLIRKSEGELIYQAGWVDIFKNNKWRVGKYWRNELYLDKIIDTCNINSSTKTLDVGCGIGTVLHFIKGKRYGIDPLVNQYKKLYKYPKELNIIEAKGESIPFPDNYFDICFCFNVLDHTENANKTLREIKRVLKSQGFFILIVDIFSKNIKRDNTHPYSFTNNNIITLIESNFEIIYNKKSSMFSGGSLDAYARGIAPNKLQEAIYLILQAKNK